MKASVELDDELAAEVEKTGSLIHEQPATVLRLAIQAGLPLLAGRAEPLRPEGYFANDYPLPGEWLELEAAMAKAPQHLDGCGSANGRCGNVARRASPATIGS